MDAERMPLARSESLVVERLDDEVLVYDKNLDRGHCLSNEAALVWDRCDGRTPAGGLSAQLGLDAEVVERALDELEACELLEAAPEPAVGSTRRELSVKLVKTGAAVAVAAPMIVSVVAPTPAQAVTLAFCRSINTTAGCGLCGQAGCCCCEPSGGTIKDCVPDSATCCALHPGGNRSTGCRPAGPCGNSLQTTERSTDPAAQPAELQQAPSSAQTPSSPDTTPTPTDPATTTPPPSTPTAPEPTITTPEPTVPQPAPTPTPQPAPPQPASPIVEP